MKKSMETEWNASHIGESPVLAIALLSPLHLLRRNLGLRNLGFKKLSNERNKEI